MRWLGESGDVMRYEMDGWMDMVVVGGLIFPFRVLGDVSGGRGGR